MQFKKIIQILVLIVLVLKPITGFTQWSLYPFGNNYICTQPSTQQNPIIISDGSGGAIIAWEDYRSGSKDIYAQRIDAAGMLEWPTTGIAICSAANDQDLANITSDGNGGAIITWQDLRNAGNSNIYAQRINSIGIVQWTTDGVAICEAANNQNAPTITSDDNGGAIITWQDNRSLTGFDIYAQKISSLGTVQWVTDGVVICTAVNAQENPKCITDGSGGAIIAWFDNRSGTNTDIYAQRINGIGAIQWSLDGEPVCTAPNNQDSPSIISDESGGAVVVWNDSRNGIDIDIYAQRLNSNGIVQWSANGVAMSATTNDQKNPNIIYNGFGGAVITWHDSRSVSNFDIYCQLINLSGVVQWATNGLSISIAPNNQINPVITTDGFGGTIITWADYRSGSSSDIYSQRVSSAGIIQWTADGVPISNATNNQLTPIIISDSTEGAIVAWADYRTTNTMIYAQRFDGNGNFNLAIEENKFNTITVYPNPSNGIFTIDSEEKIIKIDILDLYGGCIDYKFISNDESLLKIELLNKKPGVYILILNTHKGIYNIKIEVGL